MNVNDREMYHVPLEGCLNFRSLGGYACANGKITRADKFYRSNCLSLLTDADIAALENLSITHIVDLRFPHEVAKAANRMCAHDTVSYVNISLADGEKFDWSAFPPSIGAFYSELLQLCGERIVSVFKLFAANPEGRFVFHCTAGKDRTGVLSALLLDLAGVSRGDIVSDYALTQTYMWDEFMQMKRKMEEKGREMLATYIFEALPESAEAFLAELYTRFGGAKAYLRANGLTEAEIATVQNML